jgi:hypothetical protein
VRPYRAPRGSRAQAEEQAAGLLIDVLDRELAPFHPTLLHPEQGVEPAFIGYPLFSICCLELYNHICETIAYRQCANDNCLRLFVRQAGRAQKGRHRTQGVRFCSYECARAQAQRDYRTRKREQDGDTNTARGVDL